VAVRVSSAAASAPAPGQSADAAEAEILHPERELVIAGRSVVMREYGYIEGLRVLVWAKPFVDDLAALMGAASVPDLEAIQALLVRHVDLLPRLVAQAADLDPAWVESLGEADGDLLVAVWWSANAPFFVRRALRAAVVAMRAKRSESPASTPTSSGPATDAPPPTSAA
jgi:hypothetical protein